MDVIKQTLIGLGRLAVIVAIPAVAATVTIVGCNLIGPIWTLSILLAPFVLLIAYAIGGD